ncbi:PAS domain S-box protein [Noviherbaspirillum cavernae]|nr:PAS domain-containing protein [Noviherbaspirillum cavernae]
MASTFAEPPHACVPEDVRSGDELACMLVRRGSVDHCNRKLATIFGYEREELSGLHLTALFPRSANGNAAWQTPSTGYSPTHLRNLLAVHKDGTAFWVRAELQPLNDAAHDDRVIWRIEDITERMLDEYIKSQGHGQTIMRHIMLPMNAVPEPGC